MTKTDLLNTDTQDLCRQQVLLPLIFIIRNKISVIVLENQATDNFDIAYYFEEQIRKIVVESDLIK